MSLSEWNLLQPEALDTTKQIPFCWTLTLSMWTEKQHVGFAVAVEGKTSAPVYSLDTNMQAHYIGLWCSEKVEHPVRSLWLISVWWSMQVAQLYGKKQQRTVELEHIVSGRSNSEQCLNSDEMDTLPEQNCCDTRPV